MQATQSVASGDYSVRVETVSHTPLTLPTNREVEVYRGAASLGTHKQTTVPKTQLTLSTVA